MLAFLLLVIHFYVFVVSLILFSFYLFTVVQTDELTDTRKTRTLFSRERTQQLDQWVTAVHAIRRSALKRRVPLTAHDLEETRELYGVSAVDPKRLKLLGFQPQLLSYERQAALYIPELSPDSRRCDLWNERQDAGYLVRCQLSEGEAACFNCIESRKFNRYCIHVPRPIRVHLDYAFNGAGIDVDRATTEFDDDVLDIPANESPAEGYCLPAVFRNIVHGDTGVRPADETRNCNPNTGDWLLARLSVTGDTSYNWVCRCRYPNLMTNVSTLFSDCMRPVGCQPHGQLDEETRQGRRNPYTQGECLCDAGYRADRDPSIGPVCVQRVVVNEDNLPQDVYKRYGLNMEAQLRWPDDERMLDYRVATIAGNTSQGVALPNPCRYDVRTGRIIPADRSCALVSERVDGQWVAYCVFQGYGAVPVRSSRDYLRNNNGQYTNACLLLGETYGDETSNTANSILSYQVSREVDEARPDFGVLYVGSDVLDRIFELVRDDPAYREFMSHVRKPSPISNKLPDQRVVVAHGDVSGWTSVYEQVPLQSQQMHGLKEALVKRYGKWDDVGGVVYNLRDRVYYWYVVNNLVWGNAHWNNGKRSDLVSLAGYLDFLGIGNLCQEMCIADNRAIVFDKLQEREQGFKVEAQNYVRQTKHYEPRLYPYFRFQILFASGSSVDDDEFSRRYYIQLWPTYRPAYNKPEGVANMPFVYNTNFDLADSTLTLHDSGHKEYGLLLMAEQVCGEYKNHRRVMRNRLQQKWV